jgi:hypothetical protein
MKARCFVAMVAMAGASLYAGPSATAQKATVTVCIDFDPVVPAGTRTVASEMFASVGVRIHWRERRSCPVEAGAIVVSLSYHTPVNQAPGALAFARPYESTIVVFTDRVRERQQLNRDPGPALWAHVLVHEITHVLEGICRHSATGVMKDRWDRSDYFEMGRKPLPFAQEDIDLIYDGLKVRQARVATTLTAAASEAVAGQ